MEKQIWQTCPRRHLDQHRIEIDTQIREKPICSSSLVLETPMILSKQVPINPTQEVILWCPRPWTTKKGHCCSSTPKFDVPTEKIISYVQAKKIFHMFYRSLKPLYLGNHCGWFLNGTPCCIKETDEIAPNGRHSIKGQKISNLWRPRNGCSNKRTLILCDIYRGIFSPAPRSWKSWRVEWSALSSQGAPSLTYLWECYHEIFSQISEWE